MFHVTKIGVFDHSDQVFDRSCGIPRSGTYPFPHLHVYFLFIRIENTSTLDRWLIAMSLSQRRSGCPILSSSVY